MSEKMGDSLPPLEKTNRDMYPDESGKLSAEDKEWQKDNENWDYGKEIEIVCNLLDGQPGTLEDEHYQSSITMNPDGSTEVSDEHGDRKLPAGDKSEHYAVDIHKLVTELRQILPTIPKGNLVRFGGREGLIQAMWVASHARSYFEHAQKEKQEK